MLLYCLAAFFYYLQSMMPIIETIAAKKEEVQQQQSIDLQIMCEKKEIESVISSSYLSFLISYLVILQEAKTKVR